MYDNQEINVFVFICIEVEYFQHFAQFCLDLGNVMKSIILPILSGYLESVLKVPQAHVLIYSICIQYLVGAPFALITASIRRGLEVIRLWHC